MFLFRVSTAPSFSAPSYSDCHLMLIHTVSLRCSLCWPQVSQTCLLQVEAPLSTWAPFSPSLDLPLFSIHCTHLAGVLTGGCHPRPAPDLPGFLSVMNKGPWYPLPLLLLPTHSCIPGWGWRSRSSAQSHLTSLIGSTCTPPATGSSLSKPEGPKRHFGDRLC